MPYSKLDDAKLMRTLDTLQARIDERFPTRGIAKVCTELRKIAATKAERAERLARPNYRLRLFVGLILLVAGGALIWAMGQINTNDLQETGIGTLEGVDALFNITVLAAASIWFLLNLDNRMTQQRILVELHELRSIAHVIDMHQLTKDPTRLAEPDLATKSSPGHDLSGFELGRYLDYCAEMLSLTSKLAALYLRTSSDAVVIQAVNEIEELSTNLTSKIWQKIMILRMDNG